MLVGSLNIQRTANSLITGTEIEFALDQMPQVNLLNPKVNIHPEKLTKAKFLVSQLLDDVAASP